VPTKSFAVDLVQLEPMHVASVHCVGPAPEQQAWNTLLAWARAEGHAALLQTHRFFGFNHPDPAPGQVEHGYELWMTVDRDAHPGRQVTIKDVPGGLYAMTRCVGAGQLPEVWIELYDWVQASEHAWDWQHPYLEECLTPLAARSQDFVFKLYLPLLARAHDAPAPRAA